MKNLKKWLALLLAGVMVVCMLAACGGSDSSDSSSSDDEAETAASEEEETTETTATVKVGAILVGDETEGYTLAHMNGMEEAVEELAAEGIEVELSYKKLVPESDEVGTNALDLIADGCTLIVTNSYGHQYYVDDVVSAYPDVDVVCMTGDLAADSGYDNLYNAFTKVYESRYVSGVIAGLKIQELIEDGTLSEENLPDAYDEDGKIKIGYVGAYSYAEVVSGYTAFFLGIQSVVGDTVSMIVKYTNSWFSEEREAAVAEYLMDQGCVIIGQHADSTGAPAAVQARYNSDNSLVCYSVGYNVSMLDVAEDVALTSASNNWNVYYYTLFKAAALGEEIPQDWAEGYSEDAVCVTELGTSVAEGTEEVIEEVIEQIKNGELYVFDTSTFTVDGETITSYTEAYGLEGTECIASDGDTYYFDESSIRSAPYFDIRIDGITEIASDYTD